MFLLVNKLHYFKVQRAGREVRSYKFDLYAVAKRVFSFSALADNRVLFWVVAVKFLAEGCNAHQPLGGTFFFFHIEPPVCNSGNYSVKYLADLCAHILHLFVAYRLALCVNRFCFGKGCGYTLLF